MAIYEAIKDAISIAQKADNIDLYKMILDIQKEALELQEENFKLKKKCEELESLLNKSKRMVYNTDEHVFYEINEAGQTGPYCPRCWQKDKNDVRLIPYNLDLKCPICGLVVGDENEKEAKRHWEQYNFNV